MATATDKNISEDLSKSDCCVKLQLTQETTPPRGDEAAMPRRRSTRQVSKKHVPVLPKDEVTPKRLRYGADKPKEPERRVLMSKGIPSSRKADAEQRKNMSSDDYSDSENEHKFSEHNPRGLSPYELERLENIRQNQAFLTSIDLSQAIAALKPKPAHRGLKKVLEKKVLPLRKSMRLRKMDVKVLPVPEQGSVAAEVEEEVVRKMEGPVAMTPVNVEEGSRLPAGLLELWSEPADRVQKSTLSEYRATLKTMRLSAGRVVKVVKDRIFSAAFHPCSSRLLLAAGDKWGRVGLWNVDGDWGDDGVLLFEPHSRPVTCMAFSSTQPTSLLTLSYDGSLRSVDVEKAVFQELYRSDDDLNSFDFLSHDCSTVLVSDWGGDVSIIDRRTPGTSHESVSTLDPKTMRCVHVHPVHKQYFVAALSRDVRVYDVRCLRRTGSQPVSALPGHSLSISSAFFSPVTGNRVLTTCMDNQLRVFDTSELTEKVPLLTSVRHDMHTGRWLTKLRAVWGPEEDRFVVGSVERPRKVQVFHESGQLLHTFVDPEHLSTVCSVTAFHPSRNALAGGNASGRLHVFTD